MDLSKKYQTDRIVIKNFDKGDWLCAVCWNAHKDPVDIAVFYDSNKDIYTITFHFCGKGNEGLKKALLNIDASSLKEFYSRATSLGLEKY